MLMKTRQHVIEQDEVLTRLYNLRETIARVMTMEERSCSEDVLFLKDELSGSFVDLNIWDKSTGCATYRCVAGWYNHWYGFPRCVYELRAGASFDGLAGYFGLTCEKAKLLFGGSLEGSLAHRAALLDRIIAQRRWFT